MHYIRGIIFILLKENEGKIQNIKICQSKGLVYASDIKKEKKLINIDLSNNKFFIYIY